MHLKFLSPFCQATGYAQCSHDYMLALHRAGVSMQIVPLIDCDPTNLDPRYEELIPLATEPSTKKVTHVIAHTVPRAVPMFLKDVPSDVARLALTTWETTHAPRDIADALGEHCDRMIVPSTFCGFALGEAKVDMAVVPHCFDPAHWPVPETPPGDGPYSFYSILGWSERKNPIGLLKAYLSEFSANDDVILNLKLSGFSQDDVAALANATGIPVDELPQIDVITDYFDHEDMVDFHCENHCFVTAARGEGWNLPAYEAALLGRPVISPDFGGQMDFLDGYCNAFTYGHTLTPAIVPPIVEQPVDLGGLKIRPVTQTAPSGITARQHWAEPDLYALQKQMRHCYDQRIQVDFSSRKHFEDTYGYARVGEHFASLLERTTRR